MPRIKSVEAPDTARTGEEFQTIIEGCEGENGRIGNVKFDIKKMVAGPFGLHSFPLINSALGMAGVLSHPVDTGGAIITHAEGECGTNDLPATLSEPGTYKITAGLQDEDTGKRISGTGVSTTITIV